MWGQIDAQKRCCNDAAAVPNVSRLVALLVPVGSNVALIPWPTLAAGALVGALLTGSIQQYRVMSAQRALSDARSEYMARVTNAQAAEVLAMAEARRIDAEATARERELSTKALQLEREAQDAQVQYDIAIAAADDAADGLRAAVAAAEARAGHCDAASQYTAPAGKRPAAGLGQLFAELDSLAQESAVAADRAIERGLRCEAAYEAARAARTIPQTSSFNSLSRDDEQLQPYWLSRRKSPPFQGSERALR